MTYLLGMLLLRAKAMTLRMTLMMDIRMTCRESCSHCAAGCGCYVKVFDVGRSEHVKHDSNAFLGSLAGRRKPLLGSATPVFSSYSREASLACEASALQHSSKSAKKSQQASSPCGEELDSQHAAPYRSLLERATATSPRHFIARAAHETCARSR